MVITVNRASVCMGDDCNTHEKEYELKKNATYQDLFKILKEDNYFPSIRGNNVVWVLSNQQYYCIFSYFTKTDKIFMELEEKHLKTICGESPYVFLNYYSSPLNWKKKIYQMCQDNVATEKKANWSEEISYCDYVMNLE